MLNHDVVANLETTLLAIMPEEYTNPVPRPYILSGGMATPASSRSRASANRPCAKKREEKHMRYVRRCITPRKDTWC